MPQSLSLSVALPCNEMAYHVEVNSISHTAALEYEPSTAVWRRAEQQPHNKGPAVFAIASGRFDPQHGPATYHVSVPPKADGRNGRSEHTLREDVDGAQRIVRNVSAADDLLMFSGAASEKIATTESTPTATKTILSPSMRHCRSVNNESESFHWRERSALPVTAANTNRKRVRSVTKPIHIIAPPSSAANLSSNTNTPLLVNSNLSSYAAPPRSSRLMPSSPISFGESNRSQDAPTCILHHQKRCDAAGDDDDSSTISGLTTAAAATKQKQKEGNHCDPLNDFDEEVGEGGTDGKSCSCYDTEEERTVHAAEKGTSFAVTTPIRTAAYAQGGLMRDEDSECSSHPSPIVVYVSRYGCAEGRHSEALTTVAPRSYADHSFPPPHMLMNATDGGGIELSPANSKYASYCAQQDNSTCTSECSSTAPPMVSIGTAVGHNAFASA